MNLFTVQMVPEASPGPKRDMRHYYTHYLIVDGLDISCTADRSAWSLFDYKSRTAYYDVDIVMAQCLVNELLGDDPCAGSNSKFTVKMAARSMA